MSEAPWVDCTVAGCLSESFAGEWGGKPDPANALVLRATDINDDGRIVGDGVRRQIPQAKLGAKRLQPGDILLEGSGGSPDKPVGRVALFQGAPELPSVCSNFFKTLRPNGEIVDARYLWRKLGWFYKQPALLALQQQTTGIINLKFAGYLASVLNMPESVDEQAKIAAVLDTLDAAIHHTEAIIAKLKQVKQGLLHDLLTRGIDANGELRPSQLQAPHLYKQSPLGWISKKWECLPLGELAESLVDGPFGSNLKTAHYVEDPGVRVVRLQNILPNEYDDSERAFISDRHAASLSRNRVVGGDVLIASLGDASYPVGRSCCYPDELPDAVNKADCFRFRSNARCHNSFMALALNGAAARTQVSGYEQGVTMKRINLGNLRRIEIALPAIPEQSIIVERMMMIRRKIEAATLEYKKLQKMKSGLMDDLLTGRVRVTPLLEATTA
jgi:type I restriction enzyme, S subunit